MSKRADIISALKTALEGIADDSTYELVPANVSSYTEQFLDETPDNFPWILILDRESEELIAQDDNDAVFGLSLIILGLVCTDTDEELTGELNKMSSDLKKFVDSNPNLGDHVRAIQYIGTGPNAWYPGGEASKNLAETSVVVRIIYACERGVF